LIGRSTHIVSVVPSRGDDPEIRSGLTTALFGHDTHTSGKDGKAEGKLAMKDREKAAFI
jgi:hypothetical protein